MTIKPPFCSKCGKEYNSSSEEFIVSREKTWHRPCSKIFRYTDGKEYVSFPSDGMVILKTITIKDEDKK